MTSSVSLKASDKPVLKLPNLFNITPNWSRKTTHGGKQHSVFSHPEKSEKLPKDNSIAPLFGGDHANFTEEGLAPSSVVLLFSKPISQFIQFYILQNLQIVIYMLRILGVLFVRPHCQGHQIILRTQGIKPAMLV